MTENMTSKKKEKPLDGETMDPVHVVREGAVAASIWKRQSPSGFAYYDFSLSRSWKSMSSGKTGYSKNFFDNNEAELCSVIKKASAWIAENRQNSGDAAVQPEELAAAVPLRPADLRAVFSASQNPFSATIPSERQLGRAPINRKPTARPL